jgi:hypothetical protein
MAMLNKKISTFILFISMLFGQNAKPTVAILDFEGQGVDASEVQTLSERMRTEIGNTNAGGGIQSTGKKDNCFFVHKRDQKLPFYFFDLNRFHTQCITNPQGSNRIASVK